MQYINLYDPGLQKKRDWLALVNVVGGGAMLLVTVVALGFLTRTELPALQTQLDTNESQLKTLRDQVTQVGQQVASRKPDPRIEQDMAAFRQMLSERGEVLNLLKKQMTPGVSIAYSDYLRGLARQNLNGLRLVGFYYQGIDGSMEIRGQTLNPALIPEYIRRLNKEPAFHGRAFAALQLNEGKPVEGTPSESKTSTVTRAQFHEFKLIPKFESNVGTTASQPTKSAAQSYYDAAVHIGKTN